MSGEEKIAVSEDQYKAIAETQMPEEVARFTIKKDEGEKPSVPETDIIAKEKPAKEQEPPEKKEEKKDEEEDAKPAEPTETPPKEEAGEEGGEEESIEVLDDGIRVKRMKDGKELYETKADGVVEWKTRKEIIRGFQSDRAATKRFQEAAEDRKKLAEERAEFERQKKEAQDLDGIVKALQTPDTKPTGDDDIDDMFDVDTPKLPEDTTMTKRLDAAEAEIKTFKEKEELIQEKIQLQNDMNKAFAFVGNVITDTGLHMPDEEENPIKRIADAIMVDCSGDVNEYNKRMTDSNFIWAKYKDLWADKNKSKQEEPSSKQKGESPVEPPVAPVKQAAPRVPYADSLKSLEKQEADLKEKLQNAKGSEGNRLAVQHHEIVQKIKRLKQKGKGG